jgi:hypothetical protein
MSPSGFVVAIWAVVVALLIGEFAGARRRRQSCRERVLAARRHAYDRRMFLLPPPLAKVHDTPFLRSEMPSGFKQTAVLVLPADPRYHTLGSVRFDFKNPKTSKSASYALFKSSAQAAAFSRVEARLNTRGLFQISAVSVGRFAGGVTGQTRNQARALLQLAVAHLRRSER